MFRNLARPSPSLSLTFRPNSFSNLNQLTARSYITISLSGRLSLSYICSSVSRWLSWVTGYLIQLISSLGRLSHLKGDPSFGLKRSSPAGILLFSLDLIPGLLWNFSRPPLPHWIANCSQLGIIPQLKGVWSSTCIDQRSTLFTLLFSLLNGLSARNVLSSKIKI